MRVSSIKDAQITLYWKDNPSNMPNSPYVVNLSSFRDPVGNNKLRPLDGSHKEVQDYLREDKRAPAVVANVVLLAEDIIRQQKTMYMSISFWDRKGKWISQGMAEITADELSKRGFNVFVQGSCGG